LNAGQARNMSPCWIHQIRHSSACLTGMPTLRRLLGVPPLACFRCLHNAPYPSGKSQARLLEPASALAFP
jgi:hypothetical protein